MNLYSQMITFIMIVEEQSFSKAAKKLAITTTAVSKQIKQLEGYLRQQLLARNTRKVSATDIGEQFYWHCKRVEQQMNLATHFITSQLTEPQGRLKILSAHVFARSYLLKYLNEFHNRFPKIQLEVELADRIPDMEREDFDIVVGFKMWPQIASQLKKRRLLTSPYVLCASPQYLKKHGTPKTPQDLKNHKLLGHLLRHPSNLVRFCDGTEVYTSLPEILINNLEALLELCLQGLGILQICEMEVHELFKQKKLIQILPTHPMEEVDVNLFYRPAEYEQQKIRCFIDFLIEKIKRESSHDISNSI